MPRVHPNKVKLLGDPYRAPSLHVGERAFCLYCDAEVVVTSWTDAPIPWPRCRALHQRGGSGLLVDEELARAVRTESALAIIYWWGASQSAVYNWRKALGVSGRVGTEGTRRLIRATAEKASAAARERECTPHERQAKRQQALDLGLGRHLQLGYHGPWWTEAELALLGTLPDAEVAMQIGRTVGAVRIMRTKHGIATAMDRRQKEARIKPPSAPAD
jgi:hypothetical protein